MRIQWKKVAPLLLILVLGIIIISLPPVRERVAWRVDQVRVWVFYKFNPPEESVFVPQEVQASASTQQPVSVETPTSTPEIIQETALPTATPAPLPEFVDLKGVVYTDQHGEWNYCAPANLAMALSFWGWTGSRTDIGPYVKPFEKDKNVMPYELADYVQEKTDLSVIVRSGGTLELLKKLVAAGFPVVIEKGTYIRETTTGKLSWMGHYNVVTGYSNEDQEFIIQDSYYTPDYKVAYDLLDREWRSFNDIFLIVYPSDKETQLFEVLGDYTDEAASYQIAAQNASDEIYKLEGTDKFFAWYNRGTSLVGLNDYYGAAAAYDEAWSYYATLPEEAAPWEGRPWRITWYETGPYFAYYYSGRYQDVINLTTQTIEKAYEPYLEENFYWRARAYAAFGDVDAAVTDLRTSLQYHPGFIPSVNLLQELGYSE